MKLSRRIQVMLFLGLIIMPIVGNTQEMSYETGFQVQNLDSNHEASVQISYYGQDGNLDASQSDIIPAGASTTFYPLADLPEGFDGSAVITSDKEIRAICNVIGNDDDYLLGSYSGFVEGATTVYLPLLMKKNGRFDTWFKVQNVGSEPTSVDIAYCDGESLSVSDLQPGASYTFDQTTEDHEDGWVGSAVVTASQPIVATVMEIGANTMFAYNGFASGSTDVIIPLINDNGGYITGIQVMNVGDVETEVTLGYTPGYAGSARTETKVVPAGASETFGLEVFSDDERFIGSARVAGNSADQELVAIVNQLNLSIRRGGAYEGLDPAEATDTVFMPLVMDRNGAFYTGFNVVNVGETATTVNCTFSETDYTVSSELSPNQSFTSLQKDSIRAGYVGSCTCTADDGGKVMGVVNEVNDNLRGDSLLVYRAFNR